MIKNDNSGQIEVTNEFGSVYLYTHDLAHDLMHVVHDVLSKKERWNDADYLARMLFCRMIPSEMWNKSEGFGIGTQMYADIKFLINVNLVKQKISVNNWNETGNICRAIHYTFEDFIENFTSGASL
jgi:hypothetical protein